jgi:hypothetical protein
MVLSPKRMQTMPPCLNVCTGEAETFSKETKKESPYSFKRVKISEEGEAYVARRKSWEGEESRELPTYKVEVRKL